ncbi:MAG TPA: histidine kinase [Nitrospiraceae bacterium]|jgi:PleD family two-component response regulator|nr:histidine kinase [Nitrospiraceae bacterium]
MNQTSQIDQKTILVGVTDIFFYTKVRDAMISKGYKIERARTQQDIADKASATSPSAVILNLNDETLDAFQALETLKADTRLKSLPILAFANHEEVDTFNRARALGVTKIVSRNEFSARLKDLLEEILVADVKGKG